MKFWITVLVLLCLTVPMASGETRTDTIVDWHGELQLCDSVMCWRLVASDYIGNMCEYMETEMTYCIYRWSRTCQDFHKCETTGQWEISGDPYKEYGLLYTDDVSYDDTKGNGAGRYPCGNPPGPTDNSYLVDKEDTKSGDDN